MRVAFDAVHRLVQAEQPGLSPRRRKSTSSFRFRPRSIAYQARVIWFPAKIVTTDCVCSCFVFANKLILRSVWVFGPPENWNPQVSSELKKGGGEHPASVPEGHM